MGEIMQLQCPHNTCILVDGCFFLDIIQKIPISSESCSYFRTAEQEKKRIEKQSKKSELKSNRKNKKMRWVSK